MNALGHVGSPNRTAESVRVAVLLSALFLSTAMSVESNARTWRVERDGSGDFSVIQHAVDAAASGDTVRIGPGRYNEGQVLSPPGWTEYVRVVVPQEELTIIGAGESTIIGQVDTWDLSQGWHKGIVAAALWGNQRIEIRDIRFENMGDAILLDSNAAEVLGCSFWHNYRSVLTFDGEVLRIQHCKFENVERDGSHVVAIGQARVEIRDCELLLYHYHQWFQSHVNFTNVGDGLIEDCNIHGGSGITVGMPGSTVIRRCTFENQAYASTQVGYLASLSVYSCTFRNVNQAINIGVSSYGFAARDCIVESVIDCSVRVAEYQSVSIQDCDLAGGIRGSVYLVDCYNTPFPFLDFLNNYWGTDNPDEIANLIYDRNDDPTVCAYVNFIPFRSHSVPVQPQTWSGVKGLFRD